jgi:hypothetical protein
MMMEEVLVPFVEKSIQDEGLEEDSLSWLTLDGESTQINPVMKDRIQQLLKENNLIVTKPPGSTSSITQPADVGNSFKSIRSNIKSLEKTDISNKPLENILEDKFELHQEFTGKKFKPGNKTKAIQGLVLLQCSISKSMNRQVVAN